MNKSKQPEETRLDRIERGMEAFFRGMGELRESQKRTDAQLQRTGALLEKTIKKLDDIGRKLGDLGLVQGEAAEDLFYRNLRQRNLRKKCVGEYDIVACNGDAVLVIEVKNKLKQRMVDRFVGMRHTPVPSVTQF
ncbi:MAG: hypothetical protein JRH18_00165 [Deltaproteobacteria bacterium]|nr:hypothetical protein [Deltaproteobacteria bacterium]MBW1961045.1 hypothetical protein [Deltaproteobacteria bacterium]MBW1995416.1 hypothetical protein [Deltaproteobacteria bacterium]MBW2150061.1 hypothetical protein [Deltaproteobacteria bacterium]